MPKGDMKYISVKVQEKLDKVKGVYLFGKSDTKAIELIIEKFIELHEIMTGGSMEFTLKPDKKREKLLCSFDDFVELLK